MALPKMHEHRGAAFGLAALDAAGIFAAYAWSVYAALPWSMTYDVSLKAHIPCYLIFVLFWFAAAIDQRLFGVRHGDEMGAFLFAVTKALGDALVLSTVVMVLLTRQGLERDFLLTFSISAFFTILVIRAAIRLVVAGLQFQGQLCRRVIVIGANERTKHLLEVIQEHNEFCLMGVLEDDAKRTKEVLPEGVTHLGPISELESLLTEGGPEDVYVSLPVRSHYEVIQRIARLCEGEGVPVRLIADLFPVRTATRRLMYVEDIPVLSLSTIPEAQWKLALKRALDIVVSAALLVALFPVFLALGIAIKFESKGPIFFAQERVGQNQRRFKMLKFRSMVVNAEELKESLQEQNEADGPVFKMRNDPRITRIGRFIRKYSVDEFPQLINVFVGEMSLVGPRPPIASEVAQYSWDQRRRLSVKPGMTGLWQVSGRSDVGFEEWVELDLTYIDTWSLWSDFTILLRTFRAVVQGRGAA